METSSTNFFNRTNCLSLLAAISVMYIHAENYTQFPGVGGDAVTVEGKIILLMSWAVPFFFMLSGYLFFRDFTMDKLLPKWRRRVLSLVVPYLFWNTVYFVVFALLPRLPVLSNYINADPAPLTVRSVLSALFLHTYDGMMWYVRILILFVLAAPLFYAIFKTRVLGPLVLAGLFYLMIVCVPCPIPLEYMNWSSIFYYSFGACIGLRLPNLPLKTPPQYLRMLAVAGVIILIYIQVRYGTGYYALPMCCLLLLSVNAGKTNLPGGISFFLYGAHMLLISVIKKLMLLVLPQTGTGMMLGYLLVPLIALAILIPLACGIKKYLPFLWRLATGGR